MIVTTETKHPAPARPNAVVPKQTIDPRIDQAVRQRIAACPHGFVFDRITWDVDERMLTLHGFVPSFYLKQVLQELLRDIERIDRIANEVQVVSSTGLSSDRSNESR